MAPGEQLTSNQLWEIQEHLEDHGLRLCEVLECTSIFRLQNRERICENCAKDIVYELRT